MAYQYPYGDTQQLNLAWFLDEFKALQEAWEQEKQGITGALDAEIARAEAALSGVIEARDQAAASAADALAYRNAAQSASQAADLSKTNAETARRDAANYAVSAAGSAQNASNSAIAAGNSATLAESAKTTAIQQANAAVQASGAASGYAQTAGQEAANAAASATAADGSATTAGEEADRAEAAADEVADSVTQIATNKSDISDLKTAFTQNFETLRVDGRVNVPMTIERYGITESTGADNNNSNYIRTKGYLLLNGKYTFEKKQGSTAYIFTYDSSGTKLSHKYLNVSTNTYTFDAVSTNKYRISYSHSPAETIDVECKDEFWLYNVDEVFARDSIVTSQGETLKETAPTVIGGNNLLGYHLVLGDWEPESNVLTYKPNHNYRVCTPTIVEYLEKTTYTIADGYRVLAYIADDNGLRIGRITWQTGSITFYPAKYAIVIGKVNESTSVAADVETFSNAVKTVMQPINTRVAKLETASDVDVLQWNDRYYDGHTFRRCYNPYKNGGSLSLVGQLHCHTVGTASGGTQYCTPSELCSMYKDNGYDFMTITDYGYISTYDGKASHPETIPSDFVWLTDSQEVAIPAFDQMNIKHLCVYNLADGLTFENYASIQDVINEYAPDGAIISLAHPMWTSTSIDVNSLQYQTQHGLRFCEAYNGLTQSSGEITVPSGKSIDYAWEALLDKKVWAWGIAVSDSHVPSAETIVNGCVKVFCNTKSRNDILKNLFAGNFYASSKVATGLTSITFEDGLLTIGTGDANTITTFMKENGTVVGTVGGTTATYQMDGTEQYVRAVVRFMGSNEKVWTQPIINLIGDYGY